MLYQWFLSISSPEKFHPVLFRMGLSALTAFFFSVVFGKWFIRKLVAWKAGEDTTKTDSEELKRMHSGKNNTPTMGGGIFIAALLVSALMWCQMFNVYVLLLLFAVVWFAALGFMDDYIKLTKKNAHGLSERAKFLAQLAFGFIVGLVLYFYLYKQPGGTQVVIPFLKHYRPDVGIGYVPMVMFCVVVMTNAVNLTDGLDGLAVGCSVIMGIFFAVAAYISGCNDLSRYVNVPYVAGSWELSVFCAALIGGCLGFFWYNCFPAQVFMGDMGSLTLGGVLGLSGVIIKQEALMVLVGGVFIAELSSSFIQRYYYKMTKKRIFRCAPLHHHFQFKGWQETKIVQRFWIVAAILGLFGFALL